jgi:3-methyladenine DNA glycosylase Tag
MLSISSWQQLKAELLATFQGYHPGAKTTRDLLSCIQQNDESLSEYLERFIQVKAQVPNVPEATVIAVAIEGLAVGQYAAKLSRKPPTTVKELFEIMGQYAKSDDDFKRRKAARS